MAMTRSWPKRGECERRWQAASGSRRVGGGEGSRWGRDLMSRCVAAEGGSRALGDIADAPHETAAVRADSERLASVFVCLWLAGGVRLAGRLELKQAAHTRERLVSVAPGQAAGVTDAMEAVGQDVEEKATDGLVRGKTHDAAA